MLGPLTNTIYGVVDFAWPMVVISLVILVSLRISYLIKSKQHVVLYKELLSLTFVIYIMCLFQVVTFQDDVTWSANNFVPFKEILRYNIGSRLFFKNVLGNIIMFLPYGFFVSYILGNKKFVMPVLLTLIASISIEVVQMAIGRVFDIDDIILNIVGGFLGYFIYNLLDRLGDKLPRVFKSEWFLNAISIIVLIGVICLL